MIRCLDDDAWRLPWAGKGGKGRRKGGGEGEGEMGERGVLLVPSVSASVRWCGVRGAKRKWRARARMHSQRHGREKKGRAEGRLEERVRNCK